VRWMAVGTCPAPRRCGLNKRTFRRERNKAAWGPPKVAPAFLPVKCVRAGSVRRELGLVFPVCRPRCLDLPRMTFGMFRVHSKQIKQRHLAVLGVIPRALVGFLRLFLQDLVSSGAQYAKRFERLRNLPLLVAQPRGPCFLVLSDHGRVIFRNHLPEAHRGAGFGIRQVARDLPHTPLVFGGLEIKLGPGRAGGGHGQKFGAAAESFQEICQFAHSMFYVGQ